MSNLADSQQMESLAQLIEVVRESARADLLKAQEYQQLKDVEEKSLVVSEEYYTKVKELVGDVSKLIEVVMQLLDTLKREVYPVVQNYSAQLDIMIDLLKMVLEPLIRNIGDAEEKAKLESLLDKLIQSRISVGGLHVSGDEVSINAQKDIVGGNKNEQQQQPVKPRGFLFRPRER